MSSFSLASKLPISGHQGTAPSYHIYPRGIYQNTPHPSSSSYSTSQSLPVPCQRDYLGVPTSTCHLLECISDTFRYTTHTTSKDKSFPFSRLHSRSKNWLRKTESSRWEAKTSRRPKDPQPMQVAMSWERCLRLQNDKRSKAFRSSQEDACQWSTSQGRIPRNMHNCKTQNPGVHICSLRP